MLARELLSDYGVVNFSFAAFQHLNFSRKLLFMQKHLSLIVIRLVYLFPPQILEGVPSNR